MVSLKKTIEGLTREELRFQALLECYLSAVKAVQENAVDVAPELTREFQRRLRTLHRELSEEPAIPSLERGRDELVAALRDYCARSTETLAKKEDDLRAIIDALGLAAETFSGHNENHSARLKEFTTQLQIVSRGTDLGRMRMELTRRVSEFRAAAENMWRENQASVSKMQVQLAEFQKRLDRAESRATLDALTGLTNRGEGEAKLRDAMESGNLVSVILVDLNGFKRVNDQWGHPAGDQVLKTFAHALIHKVRSPDIVCRWGGDEFLMILNVNEEIARSRAAQMRSQLRIQHKLVVLGRIVQVEVGASLGVAQARSGESFEDMLTRADAELYAQKSPSKTVPAGMLVLEGGA